MPRISKETRERAAMICQVAASNDLTTYGASCALHDEFMSDALALAMQAWSAARVALGDIGSVAYSHAEAESLLRCGGRPGDEVTRG